MKNLMNLAVAVAILAVPAMGFAQNIDNAANLSQSAVSAGSLEASRDLATKALESIKLESSMPVNAEPAMSVSRVNLAASPATAQVKSQAKYAMSDMGMDERRGNMDQDGFFGTLGAALAAPVMAPILLMTAFGLIGGAGAYAYVADKTGSNLIGITAGIPAGLVCAAFGLVAGAVVGVAGLVVGVVSAIGKLF